MRSCSSSSPSTCERPLPSAGAASPSAAKAETRNPRVAAATAATAERRSAAPVRAPRPEKGARAPVSSATAAAGEDAARASARRRLVRATESIVDGGVMRACGVCKPPGRHAPTPD